MVTIGLPLLTFVFDTLTGNWWAYKQGNINQVNYELGKAKHELDKTSTILEIRNNRDTNVGLDHGVGHPLLLLCDAKAHSCRNGLDHGVGHLRGLSARQKPLST
jgi:hypothetical protein